MDQELKELLEFSFQRADATQTFWNFYIAATTAILGLMAAKPEWFNRGVCLVISIGFLLFAYGNYVGLDSVRDQRDELGKIAQEIEGYPQVEKVFDAARPPTERRLLAFHASLDLAVIVAIWAVPAVRRKMSNQDD